MQSGLLAAVVFRPCTPYGLIIRVVQAPKAATLAGRVREFEFTIKPGSHFTFYISPRVEKRPEFTAHAADASLWLLTLVARSGSVRSYHPAAIRAPLCAEMALSTLSGDAQGIILGQLCSTLEPRRAMYFSSASTELRALLPPAVRQQLRADYEAATALCIKMGMGSCKELREAKVVRWDGKGLSEADLATLATLGLVLPALERLILAYDSGSAGPEGVTRLAEGLAAGASDAGGAAAAEG